ncbi:hypothetical protein ACNJMZ_08995 [Mycobacterium tuberculosis]|uniref:hypothetical protein n=1 Tax=Mycobacterium tuberculosis TaxID=1773 RepID=UPI0004597530|nr:hypothetical protein [Mycobacterium tuberculosis]KBQ99383.1 hypothetical protein X405_00385 [Mycobacterium tuberculosis XTB13-199]
MPCLARQPVDLPPWAGPRCGPYCPRARITLLQRTTIAKSNRKYCANGYPADVKLMPGHAAVVSNRAAARAGFALPCRKRQPD